MENVYTAITKLTCACIIAYNNYPQKCLAKSQFGGFSFELHHGLDGSLKRPGIPLCYSNAIPLWSIIGSRAWWETWKLQEQSTQEKFNASVPEWILSQDCMSYFESKSIPWTIFYVPLGPSTLCYSDIWSWTFQPPELWTQMYWLVLCQLDTS